METSKALMPYVQFVHVFSGSKFKEYPLVSWEARYPGAALPLPCVSAALRGQDPAFPLCFRCPSRP